MTGPQPEHRQIRSAATDTTASGKRYRVALGHYSVQLQAADPSQALAAGRRQLCQELPRLWDVILEADGLRFSITCLDEGEA